MFRFDPQSATIRFDGADAPPIALAGITAFAHIAGEGEVALALLSADKLPAPADAPAAAEEKETLLTFADAHNTIRAELRLASGGRLLTGRVSAEIRNQSAYHTQRLFAAEGSVRFAIRELPGLTGLLANARHKEWWTRPHFAADLRKLPPRTQSLLWETAAGCGYLLPVCDADTRTDLAGAADGGFSLLVSTLEAGHDRLRSCSFVLAAGAEPFGLVEAAARQGFAARGIGGSLRAEKQFPEAMSYLGWCSWDAFYQEVDEEGLKRKAAEFGGEAGLPVRWIMIDDGWSDTADKMLLSFAADRTKFPQGLGHAVKELKETHGIRWVGAWQNIAGYWNGVHPQGEVFAALKDSLHRTRNGKWIPDATTGASFAFWQAWHEMLQRQGIDFVKIDNQSSLHSYLAGEQSIARAARAVHTGLEASAMLYFDGTILNCMGMAAENVWNRAHSSVSRSSNDFLPNIYRGFGEHALQNAYNSFYHGAFYWGDYDMFWTGHHDALPHMTLRAVSGGPVYFSDAPGKTNAAIIRPLVYSDGRIIRCSQPGRPTKDWLTKDPQHTRAPLKMWNTAGAAGIVAAFHAYEGEDVLEGEIGPADIPGLAGERFLAYDSFRHSVRRMGAEERLRIRVAPLEAELYVIVPETGAFTAIGLTDKLVAADAVLEARFAEDRATVLLKDGGTFTFVSARQPVRAVVNGCGTPIETADAAQGLYRLDCPAGIMPTTVELSF